LKVNANAAQPDAVKDPLQPLNRQIFAFNDTLDRYVLKPVAIQYVEKVPEPVRSPYRQFRKTSVSRGMPSTNLYKGVHLAQQKH
jgi:phospholipid-binding lipoprotein MlaA